MPGLVRTVGRTAAVVGTANAVTNKQQQKFAAQEAQAQQAAAYQQQQALAQQAAPEQAAPPAAAAAAEDPAIAKVKELAALHSQGILTDEEFAAAKAQALGL